MKTSQIKKRAANCLTNHWVQAIAVVFILLAVNVAFTFLQASLGYLLLFGGRMEQQDFSLLSIDTYMLAINLAGLALSYFIYAPIYMGAVWWYLHCVRGENNRLSDIFVCFSNPHSYFRVLWIKFVSGMLRIAMMIPGIVCVYVEFRLLQYILDAGTVGGGIVAVFVLGGIFTICLMILGAVATLRVALVDYLYVINPDLKVAELLSLSNRKMKPRTKAAITLILSFIPWLPVVIFVFPLLFLAPYFAMSYAAFMNDAMEKPINN